MGFIIQLKDSIIYPKFYTTIYNQKIAKTLKYLVFLFLLVFIINQVITSYGFLNGLTNMPDFSLTDGVLEVQGQQPYELHLGGIKIVLDTTGNTTENDLKGLGETVLITDTQVIIAQGLNTQSYNLAEYPLNFTRDMLIEKLVYIKLMLVVYWILAFISGVIATLCWPLLLSLGVLVIDASLKNKLSYAQAYRISAYALTLPILIESVKDNLWPGFPLFSLVYWGVGLIYAYLALKQIKQQELVLAKDPAVAN